MWWKEMMASLRSSWLLKIFSLSLTKKTHSKQCGEYAYWCQGSNVLSRSQSWYRYRNWGFFKSTFTYIAYTLLEEIFCYFMNSPSFHTSTFVSFFFFWHGKLRPSTSFKTSEIIFVSIDTRLRQNLYFAFDTNPPSYLKSSKLKGKPKRILNRTLTMRYYKKPDEVFLFSIPFHPWRDINLILNIFSKSVQLHLNISFSVPTWTNEQMVRKPLCLRWDFQPSQPESFKPLHFHTRPYYFVPHFLKQKERMIF